jgi:hypothetical protein
MMFKFCGASFFVCLSICCAVITYDISLLLCKHLETEINPFYQGTCSSSGQQFATRNQEPSGLRASLATTRTQHHGSQADRKVYKKHNKSNPPAIKPYLQEWHETRGSMKNGVVTYDDIIWGPFQMIMKASKSALKSFTHPALLPQLAQPQTQLFTAAISAICDHPDQNVTGTESPLLHSIG